MAHFAEIGLNNKVLRVIVVNNEVLLDENGIEQESKGTEFCRKLFGGIWLQTSYNSSFRGSYAVPGSTYDGDADVFLPPKPFPSWVLDPKTYSWEPPVALPDDNNTYSWDENTQSWILIGP
jgi:hypothetical protein